MVGLCNNSSTLFEASKVVKPQYTLYGFTVCTQCTLIHSHFRLCQCHSTQALTGTLVHCKAVSPARQLPWRKAQRRGSEGHATLPAHDLKKTKIVRAWPKTERLVTQYRVHDGWSVAKHRYWVCTAAMQLCGFILYICSIVAADLTYPWWSCDGVNFYLLH